MKLIAGGVAAYFSGSKAISSLQILCLKTLRIGSALLFILIVIGGADLRTHDSEDLIFGSRLLVASSPPLCQIGFVRIQ